MLDRSSLHPMCARGARVSLPDVCGGATDASATIRHQGFHGSPAAPSTLVIHWRVHTPDHPVSTPFVASRASWGLRRVRLDWVQVSASTGRACIHPATLRAAAATPLSSRSAMGFMRLPQASFASTPHRRATHVQVRRLRPPHRDDGS